MVNCAMMSVDWRDLTWWQYTAMLSVWNDRHDKDAGKGIADPERLRRFMAAHAEA